MAGLEGVKVGDILVWTERGHSFPTIKRVDRLTPKHAITGDAKWRISDGGLVGADRWSLCWARIATDEDMRAAKARKSREYARAKFGQMTDEQAIRVADFIRDMLKVEE